MKTKCSLTLYTKVKDKRDLLCNISHGWDIKYNIPFTEADEEKKCEIFGIPNIKTDFITGSLVQTGDHYYPIVADLKKKHIIGSDSEWNRIPTSGSRSKELKYNSLKPLSFDDNFDISNLEEDEKLIINKIRKWKEYITSRGAKLSHKVPKEFIERLDKRDEIMMKEQEDSFNECLLIKPED